MRTILIRGVRCEVCKGTVHLKDGKVTDDCDEEMCGGGADADDEIRNYGSDEDDENGSHDTERGEEQRQLVQHDICRQEYRYPGKYPEGRQSPLRSYDKGRSGNMNGSKTMAAYPNEPGPHASGYISVVNHGQRYIGETDHTYTERPGTSRDHVQIARQSHPDMTTLIQRAGRSKLGFAKSKGTQVDAHKWNNAASNVTDNLMARGGADNSTNT